MRPGVEQQRGYGIKRREQIVNSACLPGRRGRKLRGKGSLAQICCTANLNILIHDLETVERRNLRQGFCRDIAHDFMTDLIGGRIAVE